MGLQMVSAEVSHKLAILAQTLSIEDRMRFCKAYDVAEVDSDLKFWTDQITPEMKSI